MFKNYFKKINDNHGHAAGDKALKKFASTLESEIRDGDVLGRLGGEEFAVYFADTAKSEAIELLEKFRQFIELNSPKFSAEKIKFTISVGYNQGPVYKIDELLKQADINLYKAKESGRNRVIA